ncbi:unnamed protein product, partial [Mesorhabditis belari]|uniref:Uncharacterized protein n=1 Tax=Mesorhabditis belari TaxID=2138241 RepID=A0AAF3FEB5_9BILA
MLKKPRRRRRGRSPLPAMRWPSAPMTAPPFHKIPPSPLASPAPIARFVDDEPNPIKSLSVGRRIGKTIGKAVR